MTARRYGTGRILAGRAARWLPAVHRRLAARREVVWTAVGPAHFLVAGNGPPVVLLHGLDGSSRWWLPTIRALAPHYRCYALEFLRFEHWREYGRVPLAHAGELVAALADTLWLKPAHIIAHSMGAHAALALATTRPELVNRLVLVAPAVLLRPPPFRRETLQQLGFLGTLAPRFVPVFTTDLLRIGPLRWLRSCYELLTAPAPDFAAVRAPTLLLWGTRDPLTPASDAPELQQQIAGTRLLYLRGARHVPMYERPQACNAAILRFLAGEEIGER